MSIVHDLWMKFIEWSIKEALRLEWVKHVLQTNSLHLLFWFFLQLCLKSFENSPNICGTSSEVLVRNAGKDEYHFKVCSVPLECNLSAI